MLKPTGRYLDLLSDFGFKHLFAREANKEILIAFLNAIFLGTKTIINIEYSPVEHPSQDNQAKKVFFDLMCTDSDGSQFVIEMQRKSQKYFSDRSVYYMSRLISDQLPPGQPNWDIPLKETYLIAILDFRLPDNNEKSHRKNIGLSNLSNGELFHNKTQYIFIELPNFDKKENELKTELDKWIYLLKNLHHLKELPTALNQPIFQKIFKIAEITKLTKEERMLFDRNQKNQNDYDASIRYAAEEAELKGELKGEIKGELKGIIKVAKELLRSGMPIEQISKVTNLSPKEFTRN